MFRQLIYSIAALILITSCQQRRPRPVIVPEEQATVTQISNELTATPQLPSPTASAALPTATAVRVMETTDPGSTSTAPSPATQTSVPSRTTVPLVINYFTGTPTEIDPGDEVTLTWEASGGNDVRIWQMLPSGQFGAFWEVPLSGSLVVENDTADRNELNFWLVVSKVNGNNAQQESVRISLRCPDDWFFEPVPEGCPGTTSFTPAIEQVFERGRMIWMQASGNIWVLYADDSQPAWQLRFDTWTAGEPESDPSIVSPSGFLQPVRGFGEVWRNEAGVRERLGWAIRGEQSFDGAFQSDSVSKYNNLYLRTSDGRVVKLLPERSGWEWLAP